MRAQVSVLAAMFGLACDGDSPVHNKTAAPGPKPTAFVVSIPNDQANGLFPATAASDIARSFNTSPEEHESAEWDPEVDWKGEDGVDTERLLVWSAHGSRNTIQLGQNIKLTTIRLGSTTEMAFGCSCVTLAHGPGTTGYNSPHLQAAQSASPDDNVLKRVVFEGVLQSVCGFSSVGHCQPRDAARIALELKQGRSPVESFLLGVVEDRAEPVTPLCVLADANHLDSPFPANARADPPLAATAVRWLAYVMTNNAELKPASSRASTAPMEECAGKPGCDEVYETIAKPSRANHPIPSTRGAVANELLMDECNKIGQAGRTLLEQRHGELPAGATSCLVLDKYQHAAGSWTFSERRLRGGLYRTVKHESAKVHMLRAWVGRGPNGWVVEAVSRETASKSALKGVPPFVDLIDGSTLPGRLKLRPDDRAYFTWVPKPGGAVPIVNTSRVFRRPGDPADGPYIMRPQQLDLEALLGLIQ
jgi:hypothetical protein